MPAPPPPTTDWTAPVGGPGYGRPRASAGAGRGTGAPIVRGLKGLGRGALGCLSIIIGLAILGAVLSALEGSGATPRPGRTFVTGSPRSALTPSPVTPASTPLQVGLVDAIAADLVEMTADGMSLQELALGLDSLADDPIAIDVAPGLVFRPGASGTQSMVVITETLIAIEPGEHVDVVLDVACASMLRDTPGSSDDFTLSTTPASASLRKLVATPGFAAADFRVQQFAIWTITNNPASGGYVGLGSFGVGSGPDDTEISQIIALFKEAGIDTSGYRALR
jgi:hypothetical protein